MCDNREDPRTHNGTRKMGSAVSEGIRKATIAWRITRNKINKYTDSDKKLKIILLGSLVGGVLMYGLRVIPLNRSKITKIQSFLFGSIELVYTQAKIHFPLRY